MTSADVELIMTGTGCPFFDLRRNGPSQVLRIGDEHLLVDCGDNVSRQLLAAGIAPADISNVFITHMHTDHTHGLSQFVIGGWIQGRRELNVHGSGEILHLMKTLFEDAYANDIRSRMKVRPGNGVTDIRTAQVSDGHVAKSTGWKVTAASAKHSIESHAFRIDTDAGAVVLTGDTTYTESVAELAAGAHTIVHDCFISDPALPGPLKKLTAYHSTPELAARTAAEAGAQRLVLTHLPPTAEPEAIRERAERHFGGEVVVGEDLMRLPIGSEGRLA